MSSAAPDRLDAPTPRERVGLVLLLAVALLAGLASLRAPLGRDFGGYQGAFYSTSALGFERDGALRLGGYPRLRADEPALGGKDDLVPCDTPDGRVFAYRNHPPTSFWIGWLGARLFGPRGWQARPEQGLSPGVEHAVQAPFLALHVLALAALWWWLRAVLGARGALLGVALAASAPAALHYGSLANLENPCQPFVFAALGAHARWRLDGRARWLRLAALALLAAAAVTWAALFFALVLALAELARRRVRAAALLVLAVALPLVLQLSWSARAVPGGESLALRPARLVEPLFDGSLPPLRWLASQVEALGLALGWPLALLALAGLACLAARARLAAGLAAGATALYFLAFYRHTGEPQLQFQLWSVPVAALLGAAALQRLPVRAQVPAALVLLGAGAFGTRVLDRHLERGDLPAPAHAAARIAELVPRGEVALYADELGLNLAYGYCAWRPLVARGDAERWWPELVRPGARVLRLEWDSGARDWRVRRE